MSLAIDVAVGLAFLQLLLALVVTTTQELIATQLNWPAKDLLGRLVQLRGTGPRISPTTGENEGVGA